MFAWFLDIFYWVCPPADTLYMAHSQEIHRLRVTHYLFPVLFLDLLASFLSTQTRFDIGQDIFVLLLPYLGLFIASAWLSHRRQPALAAWIFCSFITLQSLTVLMGPSPFHPIGRFALVFCLPLLATGVLLGSRACSLVSMLLTLGFFASLTWNPAQFTLTTDERWYTFGALLSLILWIVLGIHGFHRALHVADQHELIQRQNRELAAAIERIALQEEELLAQQAQLQTSNDYLIDVLGQTEEVSHDFQAVLATIREGIMIIDSQEGTRYTNPAFEQIVGLSQMARSAGEIHLLSEDGIAIPFVQWPFQRVLRGEWADPPTVYQVITPSRERKIILIEAIPLAQHAENRRILGVVRDISSEYREARNTELLKNLAHRCAEAIAMKDVADAAIDVLMTHLRLGNATILLRNSQRPDFANVVATRNASEFTPENLARLIQATESMPIRVDAPLRSLQVLATGAASFNHTPLELPEVPDIQLHQVMQSVAYQPLKAGNETFGVLVASFTTSQERIWEAPEQSILQAAAEEIAFALHRARLYEETQRLALYDPLTGLHNHRALQAHLHQEIMVATQRGFALSVLMLDVDHFRRFNEAYGHDVGDQALQLVAQAVDSSIRNTDFSARYGGEEFTVIFPATDSLQGAAIAERIRAAIAEIRLSVPEVNDPLAISASLGLATFPDHAAAPSFLLKAADIALYASKHQGRNRVTLYSPALTTEEEIPSLTPAHAITL